MGTATAAFVAPLLDATGHGRTAALITGLRVVFSPLLWIVLLRGHMWRQLVLKNHKKGLERRKNKPAMSGLDGQYALDTSGIQSAL